MLNPATPSPPPRRGPLSRNGGPVDTANPLAMLLGSRARAETLRILFGISDREIYLSEIVRLSGMAEQGVDEQLRLFSSLGLVVSRPDGNRRYFRANKEHPFYAELHSMVLKSSGLLDVLKESLRSPKIEISFVFGSIARHEARPDSDVDLMIFGDLGHREATPAIRTISEKLNREVNPHFFTRAEITQRLLVNDHFLTQVLESQKLFAVGDASALSAMIAKCGGDDRVTKHE